MSNPIRKLTQYIGHYGVVGLGKKVLERRLTMTDYDTERLDDLADANELARERTDVDSHDSVISIVVPVYNPDPLAFKQMLWSVQAQSYPKWQLCLADASDTLMENCVNEVFGLDERVCYRMLHGNHGISANTNEAIAQAKGEYVAFMDQDDLLEPNALYEIACKIREGALLIYTDEDKVNSSLTKYERPFYKPDYNEALLFTTNYICHFTAIQRQLLLELGGLREEYDGAQDYDLVLRATARTKQVAHVDKVLYHWRSTDGSTSANPFAKEYAYEAGVRALSKNLVDRNKNETYVGMGENPGYYRLSFDAIPDDDSYMLVLPANMKMSKGSLEDLLNLAYFYDADIVAPKQVKKGRYLYHGLAARGKNHTPSLIGKPAWYHGPYQIATLCMDVDVAPTKGVLIKKEHLAKLNAMQDKHINRKNEWKQGLRMIYAPEVTVTVVD